MPENLPSHKIVNRLLAAEKEVQALREAAEARARAVLAAAEAAAAERLEQARVQAAHEEQAQRERTRAETERQVRLRLGQIDAEIEALTRHASEGVEAAVARVVAWVTQEGA